MQHHFNVELACKMGIQKAVLLNNIHYWWHHNWKTKRNFLRGRYWTFNSASAFTKLFPYMGRASIARYLRELEDDGYLLSDTSFNKLPFDRTKWYTLTPRGIALFEKSPLLNVYNENVQNETTIPDSKPDSKHTTLPKPKNPLWFEAFWQAYPVKRSKIASKVAFDKVIKTVEDANFITGQLTKFKQTQQWKEGIAALRTGGKCYIKHACRWISTGEYKDDLDEQNTSLAPPKVALSEDGLTPQQHMKFLISLMEPGGSMDNVRHRWAGTNKEEQKKLIEKWKASNGDTKP